MEVVINSNTELALWFVKGGRALLADLSWSIISWGRFPEKMKWSCWGTEMWIQPESGLAQQPGMCRGSVECLTEQPLRKIKKMNYAEQADEIKSTRSNFMK